MPRLSLSVALGVGVGGALVDVSSAARLDAGLSFRSGRLDQFDDVDPSTFSFVLDNADGRFTPDNVNSSLDTTLSEGAAACVQVGSRLSAGTVRSISPVFPNADSAWAEVRVTCDDMLGDAARADLEGDIYASAAENEAVAYWPLDDVAGSASGREVIEGIRPMRGGMLTFGVDGFANGLDTQAQVVSAAGAETVMRAVDLTQTLDTDLAGGWWNFWVTPMTATGYLNLDNGNGDNIFRIINDQFYWGSTAIGVLEVERPYFVSCTGGASPRVYIDGEELYTDTVAFPPLVLSIPTFTVGGAAYGASEFRFSQISRSAARIRGEVPTSSTIEERLELIAQAVPQITFDTIPAELTQALVGRQSAASGLEAINELMLAEQGYVSTVTTGTLTAPTQKILVRERTRPAAVSYTFDVQDELDGAPEFVRDLTNLIAAVRVDGADTSVRVSDATLTARAGSASSSETVPFFDPVQLRAWGEDRLLRGANALMRIASVTVDAMTTPTDRSADLLAVQPGDRVQFTSLPDSVLGFDTWDGWLLGRDEVHDVEGHRFSLHFAPVLPGTAIFDTDRFESDDDLALQADISAVATTMLVDSLTSNVVVMNASDVPYVVQIDDEQIQVDVVGGSFEPQSMNITRGVNGTTAAAHLAGAQVFTVYGSRFAF